MSQRDRVLAMLQEAQRHPTKGVTTAQFLEARLPRAAARIHELRKLGWVIHADKLVRGGGVIYRLIGWAEPPEPDEQPPEARLLVADRWPVIHNWAHGGHVQAPELIRECRDLLGYLGDPSERQHDAGDPASRLRQQRGRPASGVPAVASRQGPGGGMREIDPGVDSSGYEEVPESELHRKPLRVLRMVERADGSGEYREAGSAEVDKMLNAGRIEMEGVDGDEDRNEITYWYRRSREEE